MPLGIPHSVFLSWAESDQDKALAYTIAKSQICEMCGSREAEWIDPETNKMLPVPRLTPIGMTCHGCREIENYRKATMPEETPPGVRVVLVEESQVDRYGRLKTTNRSES